MSHQKKLHPFEVIVVQDTDNESHVIIPTTVVMVSDEEKAKQIAARLADPSDINTLRIYARPFC